MLGAEIPEDLPVEQHRQNAHGHIDKEGGKAHKGDGLQLGNYARFQKQLHCMTLMEFHYAYAA